MSTASVTFCTHASEEIRVQESELDSDVSDIARKRDISRLPKHIRDRMKHVMKAPTYQFHFQEYRNYKRRMYAKYGKESGVDPGVMWPTKEELQETLKDEAEWEPTLQEMRAKAAAQKAELTH